MNRSKYTAKSTAMVLAFVAVLPTFLLPACKRREIVENSFTRLTRKWQVVRTATDDNGNGVIDGAEVSALPASFKDIYVFNKDSSGEQTVTADGIVNRYPFAWALEKDSLRITRIGRNITVYYVSNLSNTDMNLILGTSKGPVGYFLEGR